MVPLSRHHGARFGPRDGRCLIGTSGQFEGTRIRLNGGAQGAQPSIRTVAFRGWDESEKENRFLAYREKPHTAERVFGEEGVEF